MLSDIFCMTQDLLQNTYPANDWIRVYTDGSAKDAIKEEEESILSGLMDEPRKHLYQQASIHPIIKQKPKPYRKLH